jgi:hypothetical protein
MCSAGTRTVSPAESRLKAVLAPHAGHGADTCLTLVGLSSDCTDTAHDSTLPAISSTPRVSCGRHDLAASARSVVGVDRWGRSGVAHPCTVSSISIRKSRASVQTGGTDRRAVATIAWPMTVGIAPTNCSYKLGALSTAPSLISLTGRSARPRPRTACLTPLGGSHPCRQSRCHYYEFLSRITLPFNSGASRSRVSQVRQRPPNGVAHRPRRAQTSCPNRRPRR